MAVKPCAGRRTLILEKNATGHRLYYARILANACALAGHRSTLVLSSDAKQSPEISIHLSALDERVERLYRSDFTYEGIVKLTHEFEPTLTVVPDGDDIAAEVGRRARWAGHGALSLLVMRESTQPVRIPGVMWAKTQVKQMLLSRARAVPGVRVAVLKGALWRGSSKYSIARDPVTLEISSLSVQAVRDDWGLREEIYWFGVLGAISERKNLKLVAEAMTAVDDPHIGLLIAGTCEPSALIEAQPALTSLRNTGARVVIVDRLLEDWELDSAVAAMDAVVLAHSNEGPSGLLGKAAAAGTRVVAAGARSLKVDSATMGSLAVWAPLALAPLSMALRWTVSQEPGACLTDLGADDFARALL